MSSPAVDRSEERMPAPEDSSGRAEGESAVDQARQIAAILQRSPHWRAEETFFDGEAHPHAIVSVPVAGGRYVFDVSEPWGPRALGFCRGKESKHLKALCQEYAELCGGETAPICRPLRLGDVRRRFEADPDGES